MADDQNQQSQVQTDTLKNIKVWSPFKVYFNSPGNSLSAVNQTGPFDVLPGHKNFMSLLEECEVVIRTDKREEKISIKQGIIHVRNDEVSIFLDV